MDKETCKNWDGAGVVPPEPKPSIILYTDDTTVAVKIALKHVMAESMFGDRSRSRLYYDSDTKEFVSYMRPTASRLPTMDDVEEIWVVNYAISEES